MDGNSLIRHQSMALQFLSQKIQSMPEIAARMGTGKAHHIGLDNLIDKLLVYW